MAMATKRTIVRGVVCEGSSRGGNCENPLEGW